MNIGDLVYFTSSDGYVICGRIKYIRGGYNFYVQDNFGEVHFLLYEEISLTKLIKHNWAKHGF